MAKLELPKLRMSKKTTISSQVYTFLRTLIIKAVIMPGTTLSENDLAEQLNVSRQPIREAFSLLEKEDLITIVPQKGTIVNKISSNNLRQVVFIRTSLECSSIENIKNLPVGKFQRIIKKLRSNIEAQKTQVDPDNEREIYFPLDDEFHALICQFSDCPMTWDVVQRYKSNLDRMRYLSMGTASPTQDLTSEHIKIVDLIENEQYQEAIAMLNEHLHEIMTTHVEIKKKYANLFEDDE